MAQNQQLKKVDGSIIWTRKEEELKQLQNEDNSLSADLTSQFEALVKQCHQILYNNGAIVGKKAMDDIMKILTLKLLQPLFLDGNILKTKYDELYEASDELIQKKLKKSYSQCIDLNKLCSDSSPFNEWKNIVQIILSKIIGNIYDDNDVKFNGDEKTITQIIDKINRCDVFNKLTREKKGIKYYDSISGGIYESFINKYLNGGGKDLGQFFTPRHMIDLMVYGLKLTDYIDINDNTSIYDPCSGSGGFLTRIYNCFPTINPKNIYGGEVEKDTMKFCISNLLLTTSTFCENLVNKNSIVYDNGKKHNIILTNPPFGTSMQYTTHKVKEGTKMIEKNGLEQEYDKTNPDRKGKFKKIYPIKTNDGACLFTQKCVYKLKKNGVLSIVLPDGQLFFGKNFMKFRKWLCEQLNIKYIVQAPSGTFEHAGIKTCVIMGIKNGATEKIQFLKTDKQCNYLEKIVDVDADDLNNCGYSFDPKDYIEDEYLSGMMTGSTVEWIELEKVCEIQNGKRIVKSQVKTGQYPVLGGGGITSFYTDEYSRKGKTCKISREGMSLHNCVMLLNEKYYLNSQAFTIESINENKIMNEYMWYYLYYNKECIFKCGRGSGQKAIDIDKFKNLKLPLPTLDIQQQIVTELEQLEEHTKTLKQLLEHTKKSKGMYEKYGLIKELRKLLTECEWKELGELITKTNSGEVIPKSYWNKGNETTYTCAMTCFKSNYNNFPSIKRTQEKDLLLTRNGNGCVHLPKLNSIYSNVVQRIILKPLLNHIYAYYFLNNIIKSIRSRVGGEVIPSFNMDVWNKTKIPLPSLEIQQSCIAIYQQKESKLKEYDQEIERIENNIKHNQELGKQIIEYYITADPQPNIVNNDDEQDIEQYSDEEQIIEQDGDDEINETKVSKIKKHNKQDNKEVKENKHIEQDNKEVKVSKIKKLINQYDENIKKSTKQYEEEAMSKKIVKTYKKQIDDQNDEHTIRRIVKKNINT